MSNILKNITKKWLGLLILLILFLSVNYLEKTSIFRDKTQDKILLSEGFILKEFPKFISTNRSKELKGWTEVYDKFGTISGYYIVSETNRWKYTGYAGRVPLFIKLNEDKIITNIQLLDNRETKRFLYRLNKKDFLKSWNGRTLTEAADSKVDVIAGVTLTSNTIIANLSEVLEVNVNRSQFSNTNYRLLIVRTLELFLLLFAVLSFFIKDMKKFRIWFLTSNTVLFGFIAGDFISMAMIRGFLTGAVTFYGAPILWIIFIFSILLPLITNRSFYCNYICPFGAAQELIGKISQKKHRLPKKIKKALKFTRPVIFGLITVLILFNYKLDLSLVEPFAAFLYLVAAPITLVMAILSLLLSIIYNKPWCKWFCPTGQFLEYFRSES